MGPGRLQPYLRYEAIAVDEKPGTGFSSAGLNYFFEGHDAKVSVDFSLVDQEEETATRQDHGIVTVQVAVGI